MGRLRLPDLRERIGGAAQTTLRGQVGNLRGIGALDRQVRSGMPYTVENELTAVGRGVLAVAEAVEAWLARAPAGPDPARQRVGEGRDQGPGRRLGLDDAASAGGAARSP